MTRHVSRDVTVTDRTNERVLTDSPVARRLSMLAAAVAVPAMAGTEAEALEFYNSGSITSNNTVGWVNSSVQENSFPLTLRNGSVANFATVQKFGNINTTGSFSIKLGTNAQAKNFLAAATNYVKTFSGAKKWTTAPIGVPANNKPVVDVFWSSSGNKASRGRTNAQNKYILFKFTDSTQDYYGWVLVNSVGNYTHSGLFLNMSVTVQSYAWQNATYGVIAAGATAVPEPSTIVTSGIAALTGGALALRRWRRARKQAEAMA